ncbi:MAG: hypothetical protein P0111_14015 [Nitrospira sp.]|nr:hypothetical protein [Nitrospira sp.]
MSVFGCAAAPPKELVSRQDHVGLAHWYHAEAARLRARAEEMRVMGEAYATMQNRPSPKVTKEEAIQHCEQFVRYYTSAANEAEALANFHADIAGASR